MLLVQDVSKVYRLYRKPIDRLLEMFSVSRRKLYSEFWALRDVSFSLDPGEFLAIIGPNGCGKSTLLQIVSGILKPTTGAVTTRGRVAALLELGAGFNPEFTGLENVIMNGELLGMSSAEIQKAIPKVQEFAGIGSFLNRPVKEYSSGMYVRLAFATAIHVDPQILIVDEALAVGDAAFANRCIRKFVELRERRVSVLFVSHDMGLVKQLAHRALFLMNGEVRAQGKPKEVVDRYIASVLSAESPDSEGIKSFTPTSRKSHGSQASRITDARLIGEAGDQRSSVKSGEKITVQMHCTFSEALRDPMVGILIRNRIGIEVYGTNTRIEQLELGGFLPGDGATVEFSFECWLTPQQYSITVATQNSDGTSQDWHDDIIVFDVFSSRQAAGVADLRAHVHWSRTAQSSPGDAVETRTHTEEAGRAAD